MACLTYLHIARDVHLRVVGEFERIYNVEQDQIGPGVFQDCPAFLPVTN